MSVAEFHQWIAYRKKNGPLNLAVRFDSAIARFGMTQVKGGKWNYFAPWPEEQEPEATPEALATMFKSLAAKTNSRKH